VLALGDVLLLPWLVTCNGQQRTHVTGGFRCWRGWHRPHRQIS
jgi:hypothetical protein